MTLLVTDDGGATDTTTVTVNVSDPTANLSAPVGGALGETLTFDASGSSAPGSSIVEYAFDRETDGSYEQAGSASTYETNFTSAGEYGVGVRVTDEFGTTANDTETVIVSAPPSANATANESPINVSEPVEFDATGSTDDRAAIQSYEWDVDGDGSYERSGEQITEQFATGGTKTVGVRVTDDSRLTDTATTTVVVNEFPTASISVSPTSPTTADTVSVDASGSSDSDGSIASYDWTLGDGATASGETASHSYADDGTYTIELTVTDDDGATDTASTEVTVGNDAPTADLSVSSTSVTTGETVNIGASGSSDSDGSIASYDWTFGDGAAASGETASHSYADDGTYTIEVTVTDDDGDTDTASTDVSVSNSVPSADLSVSSTSVTTGETVGVDASGSSDSDGSIASYDWTFGDGATASGETASHSYADDGTYTIELTVTDDDGDTNTDSTDVSVSNRAPSASISASSTSVDTGDTIDFDASGSSDQDGSTASYDWTFGDGTSATGSYPSHSYSDGGTYTVTVTVTDDDGATDSASLTVDVDDSEITSGWDKYIDTDPEASTSLQYNSDSWQYDIDLDGSGGGGELMVGTTGGQVDLSGVDRVEVDWELEYGGRGAANFGIDPDLNEIYDQNVDDGNVERSLQYKNTGGFSRQTDSLDTSGISGTRHIGVGLEASSDIDYDHRLFVYSIKGYDGNGNLVFEVIVPDAAE
ncbi:hypothetical protein BRD17_09925 [Halobacteriales archaeon SW_7_68_16]|nr:MAG: hypothetical protein BRD17_09925 [Halobacteriales archaeon SW_7_68_16]